MLVVTGVRNRSLTAADSLLYLQVPSPPGDEDEDFILVHHSDLQASDTEPAFTQLAKILKEQYEVKHLWNISLITHVESRVSQ